MIKICIISELSGGGVEQVNKTLAVSLDKKKFDVEIISLVTSADQWQGKLQFKCHFLEANSKKKTVVKLINLLRIIHPDFICTSCLVETYFCYLYKQFYDKKSKVIYTEHDVWSKTTCGSKKKVLLNGWLPRITKIFERLDGIVFVSKGVQKDFFSCFPKLKTPTYCIYNPSVSNEGFEYKDIHKNLIKLVTVGRLETVKRQSDILKAVKILLDKGYNVVLDIFGKGEEEVNLKRISSELGIINNVVFRGFATNLKEELRNEDIFILSSNWEAFGMVLVEAMNCGLPVVSTDCPVGPAEILENGKFGILVPVGDPCSLAEGIIKTINDHCYEKIASAYNRSLDFSINESKKNYESMFLGMIERDE